MKWVFWGIYQILDFNKITNQLDPYEQGQIDLINYIKAQITLIIKTSEREDQILDIINVLKDLRPLKK